MFCPQAPVWGDIATWVGGAATTLTLMFLVYQWWQQWRTSQASQIYAWLAHEDHNALEVRLGNGSGLPIYDVFVYHPPVNNFLQPDWKKRLFYRFVRWEFLEIAQMGKRKMPENQQFETPDYIPSALRILPPGNYRLEDSQLGALPGISDLSLFLGIEIVFKDSRGARWTRRASGKLKRSRISPHWFRSNRESTLERSALLGGSPFAKISRVDD